ncbi:jasmonoyl--L-amino acid synthetase GH3.5-like [Strongylocentrotus purpuratus]|uniref:GH3 middle domain-containing protein n=1 Tax=Strongylocentrotus purpuratus TaxID=7668 RepID=A0A7M7PNH9_STRPU|nr:jasmonoyl--L-amino acid synthetase GH3.5-like [Strongylocentrotus purpuratus]
MSTKTMTTLDVSYILNGRQPGMGQSSSMASRGITRQNLMKWRLSEKNKVQLFGVTCLGIFTYLAWQLLFGITPTYLLYFCRVSVLIGAALGVAISTHISLYLAPHCTPAHIMIIQYIFFQIQTLIGTYFLRKLGRDSARCQQSQENFLMNQLRIRSHSQYGRDFDFGTIKSVAEFRERHPLTRYSHYAKYMDRVAAGESDIVIPGFPSRLGITSGTTGKPKLIAISKERNVAFLFKIMPMVFHFVKVQYTPALTPLQKKCLLYVHTDPLKSPGGLSICPTSMLSLPDILHRIQFSTPPAGMRLTNERCALYIHALFGLRDRCLGNLGTIFCSTMFTFFQLLENDWPSLVNDLRHGQIAKHIQLEDSVRAALEAELQPEPERADEVEKEFLKGFDCIARRLWPHLQAIFAVSSGAMVVYARRLKDKYTKGLPIISSVYSSTEGTVAMLHDVKGLDSKYIMLPSEVFCEFIPIENSHEDQPQTLLAEEVKAGQCYELALTTVDALYRYRMGDVVKIAGFHNKTPLLEFQYRTGEVLNVRSEKTPEASVAGAITATMEEWKGLTLSLVDFTATESPLYEEAMGIKDWSPCGYYLIFVELVEPFATFGKDLKQREKVSDCALNTFAL